MQRDPGQTAIGRTRPPRGASEVPGLVHAGRSNVHEVSPPTRRVQILAALEPRSSSREPNAPISRCSDCKFSHSANAFITYKKVVEKPGRQMVQAIAMAGDACDERPRRIAGTIKGTEVIFRASALHKKSTTLAMSKVFRQRKRRHHIQAALCGKIVLGLPMHLFTKPVQRANSWRRFFTRSAVQSRSAKSNRRKCSAPQPPPGTPFSRATASTPASFRAIKMT